MYKSPSLFSWYNQTWINSIQQTFKINVNTHILIHTHINTHKTYPSITQYNRSIHNEFSYVLVVTFKQNYTHKQTHTQTILHLTIPSLRAPSTTSSAIHLLQPYGSTIAFSFFAKVVECACSTHCRTQTTHTYASLLRSMSNLSVR